MKPEIKAKFVAALRSGKYKQSRNTLKNNDCFCVNGVLCDLYRKTRKSSSATWFIQESTRMQFFGNKAKDTGSRMYLPIPVQKWAGLKICPLGPEVSIDGVPSELARHNDRGATFAQLADAIEAQL